MQAIYYLFLFILGSFIGSFLNLVSDRLPKGKKIVFGHSKCDFCGKTLKPKNLIPLLSFFIQKCRCAFCKKKLSFYYPFSEALTGSAFALAGYVSSFVKVLSVDNFISLVFYLIVFSFFVTILLTDLKFCLIPDTLVFPAILFVLISFISTRVYDLCNLYHKLSTDKLGVYLIRVGYFKSHTIFATKDFGYLLLSSLIISLAFLFLVWITKGRGMGMGDVKLGFLIGLVNGFPISIVAIFLGFSLGAIYSLVLILVKKKTMKDTIPFGPFLIMGSVIALVYGSYLLEWYIQLL